MGIFNFIKNLFSTGQTIADIPMDIQTILHHKFLEAKYSVGEDYESLIWYDDNTVSKPSEQELYDMWDDVLLIIAKKEVIEKINAKRDLALSKDILGMAESKSYYFQRSIQAELSWVNKIAQDDDIAVNSWITSTNEIVSLTKLELVNICSHLRDRDALLYIQARKHKDRVLALTTLEELSSYDINEAII